MRENKQRIWIVVQTMKREVEGRFYGCQGSDRRTVLADRDRTGGGEDKDKWFVLAMTDNTEIANTKWGGKGDCPKVVGPACLTESHQKPLWITLRTDY